ncbi:hypothetical protein [Paracoccus sp. R86501]|uniref:hypothetical protein n=1 Tax=Paracoccus sp. R86501 TaxID=3101711 RepID=UPI0036727008
MARGILTGAVHGALLGAVALAGLSLLAPLPQPDGTAPVLTVPDDGATPSGRMDLPVGSEFGRAGDVAPRAPTPIRPTDSDRASEPVAVTAPVAEPAPRPVTDDNARPDALAGDRIPAQSQPAPADAAPELQLPGVAADAPMSRSLPGLAVDAPQDSLPSLAAIPDAQDALPDPAPAMPAPGLDLSLPPDLTDLRKMERN